MAKITLSKRFLTGFLLSLLVLVVAGVSLALYASLRVQRGLLSQAPAYTSDQLYSKAQAQVDAGDYADAEGYLEQAVAKQPDDSTYVTQLAVVKYRLRKYQEAVDEYRKLVDAKQDPGFAYNGMGNSYRDWPGHIAQAESAYRSAIAADPQYVAAYSNLALVLQGEGRTAEAKSLLSQGVAATGASQLQQVLQNLPAG